MREPSSHEPNSQQSRPHSSIEQTNAGSMGGGQQAAMGNANVQVQGKNNRVWNFFFGGVDQLTPHQKYRNRQALLAKVKNFWVKDVLEKSLYNQVLIRLNLEERPDAVVNPWSMVLETVDNSPQPLPIGTKIIDVFDQIGEGRTLLILGEPGTGKTTTLLELTRDLISRAEQNVDLLLPVVLNLSSWANKRQKIEEWLVDELNSPKYSIPKKIAQDLVKQEQLILLLDGLDEVTVEYQEQCVQALNRFRKKYLVDIVVCSRIKDYNALSNTLDFQSAVCLKLLTLEQIQNYLNSVNTDVVGLKTLITENAALQELASSPLMLHIMTLTYQGVALKDLPKNQVIKDRQKQLFNDYIIKMFNRHNRSKNESNYSEEKTKYWLTWLSRKMLEHQSIFLIEEIQPDWLVTQKQYWQYIFSSRLIGGIIFVVPFSIIRIIDPTNIPVLMPTLMSILLSGVLISFIDGIFIIRRKKKKSIKFNLRSNYLHLFCSLITSGMIFVIVFVLIVGFPIGLIMGLTFGVFTGLLFGLRGMKSYLNIDIKTYEKLNWSWKSSMKWGLISLGIAIILANLLGLVVEKYRMELRLVIALISVSLGIVFGGLSRSNFEIKKKSDPNQGIRDSFKSSILGAMIGGFIGVLVGALRGEKYIYAMETFSTLGLSMGALWYGGLDMVRHLSLRMILYLNNYIPWNYAYFLNYAVERIFLQRVGGGYIFIHRMLMEHFAQMDLEQEQCCRPNS